MTGRTSTVIAQVLATVRDIDRVILIESGSPVQLFEQKGRYARMYREKSRREAMMDLGIEIDEEQ